MANTAFTRDGHYTWDDYQTWPDEERRELIQGTAYDMSPAPGTRHQIVSIELGKHLSIYFAGKECRPFAAPVDVRLSDEDVVQPDLLVVCEGQKIKPTHIEGAPTLVVEIQSPSTSIKDRTVKMELYARSGVQEVWIVTPYPSLIEVFSLTDQGYCLAKAFAKEDMLKSIVFGDLEFPLEGVFDFPPVPEEIRVVKESPGTYQTAAQGAE